MHSEILLRTSSIIQIILKARRNWLSHQLVLFVNFMKMHTLFKITPDRRSIQSRKFTMLNNSCSNIFSLPRCCSHTILIQVTNHKKYAGHIFTEKNLHVCRLYTSIITIHRTEIFITFLNKT